MNRRDFLRSAAIGAGATGTILVMPHTAQALLSEGRAELAADDIKAEGRIITQEDLVDEAVGLSIFGDNLARVLTACPDGMVVLHKQSLDYGRVVHVRVLPATSKTASPPPPDRPGIDKTAWHDQPTEVYLDPFKGQDFRQHPRFKVSWN
jgi:hypothetical protein